MGGAVRSMNTSLLKQQKQTKPCQRYLTSVSPINISRMAALSVQLADCGLDVAGVVKQMQTILCKF